MSRRTLQQVIDSADELAEAFEKAEPSEALNAQPLRAIREAATRRAHAEADLARAVAAARKAKLPWSAIGMHLGTSGEAARQRYARRDH